MSSTTSSTPPSTNSVPAKTQRLPPDEKFWKRYSPHHEFPLSGAGSFVLHGLFIGLLIVAGWLASKLALDDKRPIPIDSIKIAAGGGGNPEGIGEGPGGEMIPALKEATPKEEKPETKSAKGPILDVPKPGKIAPPKVPEPPDPKNDRSIEEGKNTFQELDKETRKIQQRLDGVISGKGKGGLGKGGGKGKGTGTGEGDFRGPGKSNLTRREKRQARWKVQYSVRSDKEYLEILRSLDAVLAFPKAEGKFWVIRKIEPPYEGKIEDTSKFPEYSWVDDKRESVRGVAASIGLSWTPDYFECYFPKKVEDKLLGKELAYLRANHPQAEEDDIDETIFVFVAGRNGNYDFAVSRLTLNKSKGK